MACTVAEKTQTDIANGLGVTKSAFSQRMKTGKFSDADLQKIAEILGAEYFSGFRFKDGTEVK